MKAFKKLKEIILDNLSLKDFFMSDILRNHLAGIVKMVSERYGDEEMFVKTKWGGEDIAYTDNRTVFINLNNQIIKDVNDPEERYLCLLGLLGHELGHVLYTDFDSSEDFCSGKKGNYLGLNNKEKKVADEISDYRAKGFTGAIGEITHRICNSIEDGFVNRKISENFPGTFKQGIKKLHSIQFSEELKSVGNSLADAINAILSLSLGYPISDCIKKSVDCSDALEEILKDISKAEAPIDRMSLTNRCLIVIWKYLKPMLDVAEQMSDSRSGDSQNGNDSKGQQSGSSSQGGSGQSSQNQSSDSSRGTSAVTSALKQAPQNSQAGKGKGILNKKTQNSSSQSSNAESSQGKTGGQQNNRQEASVKNDKSRGDSQNKDEDAVLGSQNNKPKDVDENADKLNNTSGKEDKSNRQDSLKNNEDSESSGSDNNADSGKEGKYDEDNKNDTTGDGEDTVDNNNVPDSKEDNKQDSESDSNSELSEDSTESKSTEEPELSPENAKASDYEDNGYNSEAEGNNSDGLQDFGNDGFESETTYSDMPETPSDATFDGQTGTGEQDIKSALEGLLSQYAQRYAERNPEKVEKLMLEANAKDIASGNNSPHNGYPFTVNNIKGSNNYRYDLAAKRLSGISKRLQKRVEQVLEDQNDGGVCKNLLMGNKINPAASASSHGKIFKRNILPETKDIAISILIDESGSMSGNRIEKALEMAIIIEDFCTGLNIPLSIVGHCDNCGRVQLRNYILFEDTNKNRKYNLAEMRAGGCNRDGFALGYCIKNLLEREEENKLMIIISDGKPNSIGYSGALAEKDLQSIKTEFERKGGRLIAAAIGDDRNTIKRIYGNSFLDVTDINNLPIKMASIISRYVQN